MAVYSTSSTGALSLCISSINNTSQAWIRLSNDISSDGFAIAYPVIILIRASVSRAVIEARVVFPYPLLPENNT